MDGTIGAFSGKACIGGFAYFKIVDPVANRRRPAESDIGGLGRGQDADVTLHIRERVVENRFDGKPLSRTGHGHGVIA